MYYLRITAYADELLASLNTLPGWPERVKTMQANWIGKSLGVDVIFPADAASGMPQALKVFTTRADTLLGRYLRRGGGGAPGCAACGKKQS